MRVPFARWDPVNFHDKLARRDGKANAACFHTNDGGADLTPWFDDEYARTGLRIGCTFQVLKDGTLVQLADTDRVIYAEFGLSERAVSIEHEDDGDPSRPLTKAQMATDVRLLRWLHEHEAVPLRLMTHPDDHGVTWHERFSIYDQNAHACPGRVREHQIVHVIMPAVGHAPPPGPMPDPHPGHTHIPKPLHDLPLPWMTHDADTARWQRRMIHRGWRHVPGTDRPFIVDGVFGMDSEAVAHAFERQIAGQGYEVSQDGRVGLNEWRAAWAAPITK